MPDKPMTVVPVYSDEATGGQSVVDFEVLRDHHASVVDNSGQLRNWEQDFTPDEHGRFVYEPRIDDEIEGVNTTVGFNFDEYGHTFRDSVGGDHYDNVLLFASENFDESLTEQFDAAIDAGNITQFNELFELFQESYLQFADVPEVEETEATDDDEPLDEAEATQFAEVLEDLTGQEPAGMEVAYNWLEAAEQWQQVEPVVAEVCKATAAFHNSNVDAATAIDNLTAQFTPRQLAKAFSFLNTNG